MNPDFEQFKAHLERVSERLPGAPRTEIILTRLYFFVSRALTDDLNQSLSAFGLNTTSVLALIILYASPDQTTNPSSLSHGAISSRTNITRLVDELVSKGWVEKRGCTEDRRKVFVTLTAQGRAIVEQALPRQWARMTAIWDVLTPGEAALLGELLQKIWNHLLTNPERRA